MFQKSYIPAAYLHPVLYFLNTSFDSVSDFLYAFLDCVARSLDPRLDRFAYFLGGNSVRYPRQKFFFANYLDACPDRVTNFLSAITNFLSNFLDSVASFLGDGFDRVPHFLDGVPRFLSNTFDRVPSFLGDRFDRVPSLLSNRFNRVPRFLSNGLDCVACFLGNRFYRVDRFLLTTISVNRYEMCEETTEASLP